MKPINYVFGGALLLALGSAYGGTALSQNHPEEAYPDNLPMVASPGPYAPMIKEVQQKLHELGFDAGPVNGDFGTKTQAALVQFQLSEVIPASGQLDAATLLALDVTPVRSSESAAGGTSSRESGSSGTD
jgi:peptidoglycan hydrolase-like protein with peptidoglycan-binding domain